MNPIVKPGRALLGAALIIAISAALAWLEPLYLSSETSRRLLGALLGAVVVIYSNAIPKFLAGRGRGTVPSAASQAARRFAGWSMVLGAIGYMLAWLLAPLDSAALVGGGVLAAAVLIAVVRCLRGGAHRAGT